MCGMRFASSGLTCRMQRELTNTVLPWTAGEEVSPAPLSEEPAAWDQIVSAFRQACILKQAGNLYESNRILQEELPRSIASWSRHTPLPSNRQTEELRHMFDSEQKRIRDLWTSQEAMAESLTRKVLQTLSGVVGQEIQSLVASQLGLGNSNHFRNSRHLLLVQSQGPYKRVGPQKEMWDEQRWNDRAASPRNQRLSFDDIPGTIDVVLDQQHQKPVPSRSL